MENPRVNQKFCFKCSEWKPKTEFHRNKKGCGGLQAECGVCVGKRVKAYYLANHAKVRQYKNAYRTANKEKLNAYFREAYLKRKYEMVSADKLRMHTEQGGRCKCCSRVFEDDMSKWCIDHNHTTNKVRGLICRYCNSGIGMLGDDAASLRKALCYLEANDG
jgi:Recombination endonuclease VII